MDLFIRLYAQLHFTTRGNFYIPHGKASITQFLVRQDFSPPANKDSKETIDKS